MFFIRAELFVDFEARLAVRPWPVNDLTVQKRCYIRAEFLGQMRTILHMLPSGSQLSFERSVNEFLGGSIARLLQR